MDSRAETLKRLKGLREKLASQGSGGASTAENVALRAENEALKAEIAKLNYRVNHLVDMLNAEEAKRKE
jgi:cell division protein FtsB